MTTIDTAKSYVLTNSSYTLAARVHAVSKADASTLIIEASAGGGGGSGGATSKQQ